MTSTHHTLSLCLSLYLSSSPHPYSPCLSLPITAQVPLAANVSFSALLAIRALIGLAAAATFPSIYHFYPR